MFVDAVYRNLTAPQGLVNADDGRPSLAADRRDRRAVDGRRQQSRLGQADLTGSWNGFFHEDQPERIPGPSLGDYLGLPINDSARAFAEAWDASRLTIPEHQCRAHSSPYILRGPLNMRIWEERDPQTQQIVAIHQDISNFQQRRTFWMDGRPHPSQYAEHTWMGFSTGRWEGDALVVTTTHIKQMWHRRNGIPQSDRVDADRALHPARQRAHAGHRHR